MLMTLSPAPAHIWQTVPPASDGTLLPHTFSELEQIYEPKFYDESYGFRPNRNCHKAVKKRQYWARPISLRGPPFTVKIPAVFHDSRFQKFPYDSTKYGLELAEEKTRILEFGRFAEEDRKRRGEGKPETFDFQPYVRY